MLILYQNTNWPKHELTKTRIVKIQFISVWIVCCMVNIFQRWTCLHRCHQDFFNLGGKLKLMKSTFVVLFSHFELMLNIFRLGLSFSWVWNMFVGDCLLGIRVVGKGSWKVLSWKVWSWKEPSEAGKNRAKFERTQWSI